MELTAGRTRTVPLGAWPAKGIALPRARGRHIGNWSASLLIGLYFFNMWQVSSLWVEELRWFHALGLSFLVFFLQGMRLSLRASRRFMVINGLMLAGGVLSVFRAFDPNQVVENVTAMVIAILTMMLMLPTLATRRGRAVAIVALILAAFLKSFEVHSITAAFGGTARLMFIGKGADKNYISLCLALAATALFSFALFWAPTLLQRRFSKALRLLSILGSVYLIYTASLTYSRSGLITALVGILSVLVLFAIKKRARGWLVSLCLLAALTTTVVAVLPDFVEANPDWELNFERFVNWQQDDTMDARRDLVQKGILLISENPFVGVGPGLSKATSADVRLSTGAVIHNSYLTIWAELGLLGAVAIVLWMTYAFKELKAALQGADVRLLNLLWAVVTIPFFVMFAFLDMGTVSAFFLTLLAGFAYERQVGASPRQNRGAYR